MTDATKTAKPRFANDGSYESIRLQVKKLAHLFYGRARAIGIAMDIEDVEQEINFAYVKARGAWRPEGGARFSTYFQTVACRHFNDRIRKEENERANLGMGSMSALADKWGMGDEDESSTIEAAQGIEDSREDSLVQIEEMRERLSRLTPDARRLVALLLKAEGTCQDVTLKGLCTHLAIEGARLRSIKAELNAHFGVTWR